jgi:hypothetical protein
MVAEESRIVSSIPKNVTKRVSESYIDQTGPQIYQTVRHEMEVTLAELEDARICAELEAERRFLHANDRASLMLNLIGDRTLARQSKHPFFRSTLQLPCSSLSIHTSVIDVSKYFQRLHE